MTRWLRFEHDGREQFGTLEGETITVHAGEMFGETQATSEQVPLAAVRLLTPCRPGKMVALWNNYHALAQKMGFSTPEHPLYFFKADTSFAAGGETVRRPQSYDGKVIYEGELGIVIGKTCKNADVDQAGAAIFGYTCINDITAAELINKDASFAQWVRAKSFDGFGVMGPVVATGLDPASLSVKTVLNGQERQNYPVSDIVFPPPLLVSLVSRDMTLNPGDVIACGTSLGVGSMKEPSNLVEVTIEGIGTLSTVYEN
jgi:2-keto-4-pentenoate hydratase/2-oxohepta-3-ene-1,7-dioic acid hydratase in catechol pathway